MKHLELFEAYKTPEEVEKERKEKVEILKDLLDENPLHVDHDFFMFIGRDSFIEEPDGRYKKSIEIENMVKITPDSNTIFSISGLELRARFNPESTVYHLWLPKEISEEVEGKGSYGTGPGSIEPYLVELINKYKQKGSGDDQGRQIYKDVIKRRKDVDKYNL